MGRVSSAAHSFDPSGLFHYENSYRETPRPQAPLFQAPARGTSGANPDSGLMCDISSA